MHAFLQLSQTIGEGAEGASSAKDSRHSSRVRGDYILYESSRAGRSRSTSSVSAEAIQRLVELRQIFRVPGVYFQAPLPSFWQLPASLVEERTGMREVGRTNVSVLSFAKLSKPFVYTHSPVTSTVPHRCARNIPENFTFLPHKFDHMHLCSGTTGTLFAAMKAGTLADA